MASPRASKRRYGEALARPQKSSHSRARRAGCRRNGNAPFPRGQTRRPDASRTVGFKTRKPTWRHALSKWCGRSADLPFCNAVGYYCSAIVECCGDRGAAEWCDVEVFAEVHRNPVGEIFSHCDRQPALDCRVRRSVARRNADCEVRRHLAADGGSGGDGVRSAGSLVYSSSILFSLIEIAIPNSIP